jgi:nitrogen-specific signal transduction histidine kinase/CheY-like chemotaxis protein
VLVTSEVTQEREIQRRLRQQERLAAVWQLAPGIAHDFNNIMAVIVLYTQMGLRLPDVPVKLRERLETVARQANRATDLIQQILDFSRRAVLERRPMDLTPFLIEVVKLLERTIAENVRISLNYGTGEYTVNADPTRMQQAILNLVVNARDAMPEGGELSITVSRVAETDEIRCVTCGQIVGGEWVRIAVRDTGSGIPPEVLSHIFEPFFTTKEVGKGTGLGLAQVYGIVRQHEGHTDVTTKVGEGTTFIVYLPALLDDRQPEAPALETEAFVKGQGETILVVEDDAILREALVDSVELMHYQVLEAADGHQALDILEQQAGEVSLVLSDLVMPKMGGQSLFHAMRQRGLTVPLVILSGHPMEDELKSLQAQGLAGWMLKPPDMAKLSHLLARVLRKDLE